MGFFAWMLVGLIAGWLAGQVMKGGGYGVVVDIILGILGGVLGGWVFGSEALCAKRPGIAFNTQLCFDSDVCARVLSALLATWIGRVVGSGRDHNSLRKCARLVGDLDWVSMYALA